MYYTYILQNRYNIYETDNETVSRIELFSHNYICYDLVFEIFENSQEGNGFTPSGYSKYVYTGPYDLTIVIEVYFANWIRNGEADTGRDNDIDLKKITFNRITLNTKNKSVDIRDKIIFNGEKRKVYHSGNIYLANNIFDEDDFLLLKNYGTIDLAKQRETLGYNKTVVNLFYENIDIDYKKDKNFTIEFDITIEKDDGTSDNKTIEAKYVRKTKTKFKERAFYSNFL